ncbi:MAG TPA: transposase, partial [Terriglobales bacterium]|nr:transposase [Terriglobales bacterium]
SLATLSDGSEIANPVWVKQFQERVARANRKLSRKQPNSKNRARAREHLRRLHQRIAGRRRSYLHPITRALVARYDLLAFEKLNIAALARSRLAKSILDAAWGEFIWQLTCKAEEAGKRAVAVNPRGTTQLCSGCGEKVPKQLSERTHQCPSCGLILGRDHNSARNILRLGESLVEVPAKC